MALALAVAEAADGQVPVLAPERLQEAGGGLEAVVGGDEDMVLPALGFQNERQPGQWFEATGIEQDGRCG